jgi:hypothetical protein
VSFPSLADHDRITVQINAKYDSAEQHRDRGRAWIDACLASPLLQEIAAQLAAGPAMVKEALRSDHFGPIGAPHGLFSSIFVNYDGRRSAHRLYTPRNRQVAQDKLLQEPMSLALTLRRLDAEGNMTRAMVEIKIERPVEGQKWAGYEVTLMRDALPWIAQDDYHLKLRDLAAAFAATVDATFAAVGNDFWGTATRHEIAIRSHAEETIPETSEHLRGYSWVTICPPAFASRLDLAKMAKSFFAVEELTNGYLVLQATDKLHDYQGDDAQRVYGALTPVLTTGRTYLQRWRPDFAQRIVSMPAEGQRVIAAAMLNYAASFGVAPEVADAVAAVRAGRYGDAELIDRFSTLAATARMDRDEPRNHALSVAEAALAQNPNLAAQNSTFDAICLGSADHVEAILVAQLPSTPR